MPYKKILGIVPTLHSIALVKRNLKAKKKKLGSLASENIVGTNLIKIESDFINAL